MQICYLVLAHAQPKHFGRLIDTLTSRGDYVVAHIDAKTQETQYWAAAIHNGNVSFVQDRVDVKWFGYTTALAIERLFETGRRVYPDADYYWLISGDSYLLASPNDLRAFLSKNRTHNFVNILRFPSQEVDKPRSRVSHYYIEHDPRASKLRLLYKVLHMISPRPYKRRLGGLDLYCGSAWLTLTAECTDYLLHELRVRTDLRKLAKSTKATDEFYFHTILGNSPFSPSLMPAPFWADFRPSTPRPRPPILNESHLRFIRDQDHEYIDSYGRHSMLVGRKFTDQTEKLVTYVENSVWPAFASEE
ncbi:hypothetical protein HQO83_03040 [Rhodococcus fascians]|nr:hypothetical protein [Rhodococcus fascians]